MNGVEQTNVNCPYCGETIVLLVDCSVERQCYIEDCEVCCRPITVAVAVDGSGTPFVEVAAEDEV